MSDKFPVTTAVRALRAAKVVFDGHLYAYEERGGTKVSARELGVDEHIVIKTIVLEDEKKSPLLALQHGDLEVSTKNLARFLERKSVGPASAEAAHRHTGYEFGGTSPFGTRKPLPVYVEASVLELPRIFINGGKRGFLVSIDPKELVRVLGAIPVEMAAS